jgi:hypothetical protein
MQGNPESRLGLVAACWAIAGWSAVLGFAIARLAAMAIEAAVAGLGAAEIAVLVANTAFLAWAEGYRGFQQRFSPRTAARVLWLRRHATPGTALLAPLFCIGFFGATPRILRLTWIGFALIVLAVLLVQQLPQPWRGVVDAGVVVGLGWGLVSFLLMCRTALRTGRYPADPAVPAAVPAT